MNNAENWVKIENTTALKDKGRMVFRQEGKQILLIRSGTQIFAVNNRCPHEGYPLSEGSLSQDCSLTCNWHNWKFDLKSGDTLVGGDRLRHYPVRQGEDGLWIDLQDISASQVRQQALDNIQASFDRYEYDRMGRELARFRRAGGAYQEAVLDSLLRNYDRLEYGMGHAFAAAADWLAYGQELEQQGKDEDSLATVLEIISHVAWDCQRNPSYPYTQNVLPYTPEGLRAAIEAEDENRAIALTRGALKAGLTFGDLMPVLSRAALDHYKGFGHAAIYTYKAGQLADLLGEEAWEALLFPLVRYLVYANREDLIPEFRAYSKRLALWDGKGDQPIFADDLKGLSVSKSLARVVQSSARPEEVFLALQEVLAWNMLHFDVQFEQATDNAVVDNVNWLDFTHGLTFANAVRVLCEQVPDLWPRALLQMACFNGRNQSYIARNMDLKDWYVADRDKFFAETFTDLLDHGQPEPIISAHLMKLSTAVRTEVERASGMRRDVMLAGLNRFLHSPIKRKHLLRTARQAYRFVAREG
ncbi:Rieske (2Fe-2S) protein [Paremcibacter congregatus]|uniref:Rieske domain-containing protein n=1 Tax=Paremcibacter congregatus TaxID=2043170 RepID=A0A2G4YU42_9PROT|nr:Rieske (2Fe-2S) protein [Paremcibacter congregatus]PHZ85861.1 hypothetical protein CRD36_04065 [Paremcibacter congregatus]QDE26825.1 Rieske (2Fe-2S) protein [Paremcibacter congregatus]